MNEELTGPDHDNVSMSEVFAEQKVESLENADSLWLNGKKEERESSSGSGEERGRAKVCSAPGKTGVMEGGKKERKEGGRGVRRGKKKHSVLQRQKVCGRLVKS